MSPRLVPQICTVFRFLVFLFSALLLTPVISSASQVTLGWDPNIPTPSGYNLYQRSEGQTYDYSRPVWSGTGTVAEISGLEDSQRYYFVARAYTGSNESSDSNEISFLSNQSSPPPQTTYTISVNAGSNGTISPGAVVVNKGDSQTFSITSDAGYHVAQVTVDGVSAGAVNTYTFSQVSTNHTISANFAIDHYTISASAGSNGSISPAGNIDVMHGGEQTFSITPDSGYHVSDVKVDGISIGSQSSYTFSQVSANRSIAVTFSRDSYTVPKTGEITLGWDPNDPAPDFYSLYQRKDGDSYDYSQPCWTGQGTSTTVYNLTYDTTYYFVVRAQTGIFKSPDSNEITVRLSVHSSTTHTISASAGANGSLTPSGSTSVNQGASQSYLITPNAGYRVANVIVDGVSVGSVTAYTFDNVTTDHSITASFTAATHTISASADGNGSISPSGSTSVNQGAGQSYLIRPNTGYRVANVTVDGVSVGSVTAHTFDNVTADHSITASFTAATHTISASAGLHGSINPSGAVSVIHGGSKNYTITPASGYQVANVLVDGVFIGSANSFTFSNVSTNHTISATFEADTFTITIDAGANGTVSPSGAVEIAYGGNQTFTFSADKGFHIEDVQVDGQSVGVLSKYTLTNVTKNHTIFVSFAETRLVKIWLEAEDGDLQWPMEIADDENAGAGGYVWVAKGTGNLPTENSGYAEYQLEVPESGEYVIWGRHISPASDCDSFSVSVDGKGDIVWHTRPAGRESWTWDVVSVRGAPDIEYSMAPERFVLAAGRHTLRITNREDGTKLDRILITNQLDLTDPESDSLLESIEFGEVQLNHTWSRISFQKQFEKPVVVAGPLSLNGGDPAVIRIRNVDATGFEIHLQEWQYLDGSHMLETVSYLVMEAGNYNLSDGTRIEAAFTETDAATAFQKINFNEPFNVAPVVMTTLTSFNEADTVTGRLKQITPDGFNYRMQEQELNTQSHAAETLAYIAWEPSSGQIGDVTYLVGSSADAVTHKGSTIFFKTPFASSPALLADMQTTDGADTANIRYLSKDVVKVEVLVDEEQSKDSETGHTTEIVGYMVLAR